MTTEPVSRQETTPAAPPPLPESGSVARPASNTVVTFIASRFWWIVAGAALVKLVAYFVAPQPPSTFGGHIGGILRGFTVFGISLAIVAGIVSLFFKAKARIFRVAFAILFALACLLNLPSACLVRHAYTNASSAAAKFAAATPSTARTVAEQLNSRERVSSPSPNTHHADTFAGAGHSSSLFGGCSKCGGSKTVIVRCTTCGGDGLSIIGDCPSCNGAGTRRAKCTACQTISSQQGSSSGYGALFGGCSKCGGSKTVTVRCTTCGGNGLSIIGDCPSCNGTGTRLARCTACNN